jgi:hypothetical protein
MRLEEWRTEQANQRNEIRRYGVNLWQFQAKQQRFIGAAVAFG